VDWVGVPNTVADAAAKRITSDERCMMIYVGDEELDRIVCLFELQKEDLVCKRAKL